MLLSRLRITGGYGSHVAALLACLAKRLCLGVIRFARERERERVRERVRAGEGAWGLDVSPASQEKL